MNINRRKMGILICSLVVACIFLITGSDANADFIFGTPTNLGPTVNSSSREDSPCISSDGLSLYFQSTRGGGLGAEDIWVTTRETVNDPWGEPVNLGSTVNSSAWEIAPSITVKGELHFGSTRPGGYGFVDGWVTTRETVEIHSSTDEQWSTPINIGPVLNGSSADQIDISFDGLTAIITSNRPGGYGGMDLWISTRPTLSDAWSELVNLGPEVNCSGWDMDTALSADNRFLFFTSPQSGGEGGDDLWLITRATTDDAWSSPINLGPEVNTSYHDSWPGISFDGCTLYFCSNRPGGSGRFDLWQVSIDPVVDLNGDGIVDATDMCMIVDNWGTDNPLCDIGPMPWGDGIVDIQDLVVLAEHLPPVLLAHWEFDEIEGGIAYDSSGGHVGMLNGNPLWQPAGGKVNGALLLDGIDDYVNTPFVIDPARRSSSTFAWIKGGGPGQVIISQVGDSGEIWLGIDASEGKLITGFCDVYFDPLVSDVVITDDQWHHVGLVYDLDVFHRRLYVDGTLVIEDTSGVAGVSSDGGLYIGASKNLEGGSFFSGLVDDVRIYRRVLSPQEIAALAQ